MAERQMRKINRRVAGIMGWLLIAAVMFCLNQLIVPPNLSWFVWLLSHSFMFMVVFPVCRVFMYHLMVVLLVLTSKEI